MATIITKAQLTQVAAAMRGESKAAAREALKAAQLPQSALIDAALAAYAALQSDRRAAKFRRLTKRLGYTPVQLGKKIVYSAPIAEMALTGRTVYACPDMATAPRWRQPVSNSRGRPAVGLPRGNPTARLNDLRRHVVSQTYAAIYRQATHGDLSVILTTDPAAIGVRQVERQDWDLYRGMHKGRPARVQDTTVTVPADWRVRVQRRGLDVVDGMMTLDAAPVETVGCELFAAAWIEQGRGTSATLRRGYIARAGGHTYHGSTADMAMSGLQRKARAAAIAAALAAADLDDLVPAHAGLIVRVADARAVGACEYGIRSWCAAVGLDYEVGQATLGEIYAAYRREPRPEARATILHVLRRARAAVVGA